MEYIIKMKETVTISSSEYQRLLACEKYLEALASFGVHTWQYYDEAIESIDIRSIKYAGSLS